MGVKPVVMRLHPPVHLALTIWGRVESDKIALLRRKPGGGAEIRMEKAPVAPAALRRVGTLLPLGRIR